jgi:hypothetical protein
MAAVLGDGALQREGWALTAAPQWASVRRVTGPANDQGSSAHHRRKRDRAWLS